MKPIKALVIISVLLLICSFAATSFSETAQGIFLINTFTKMPACSSAEILNHKQISLEEKEIISLILPGIKKPESIEKKVESLKRLTDEVKKSI